MAIMRNVPTRYDHLRSTLESKGSHIKQNGIPILTGNAETSKRLQNSKLVSLEDSLQMAAEKLNTQEVTKNRQKKKKKTDVTSTAALCLLLFEYSL